MTSRRRTLATGAGGMALGTAAGLAALAASRAAGRRLVARTERRLNPTTFVPPYAASERARVLHEQLLVADLHADSLLWGRDLLVRGDRGHVDVPRLVDGNVALQVFAASTKSPRHLNIERNSDDSDDIVLLAIAQGWPAGTWRSLMARALHMAARADGMARRSSGRLTMVRSAADLSAHLARRTPSWPVTAGLLAIEGAHALDDDPANIEVVFDAGFRMMSPCHFFDNAFSGSAHGVEKGGLTPAGHELIRRMEARSMVVDVAHASAATIDDVLAVATRPVVASHTGVRGVADNARNLSDDHLRGIAATGGLIGIGFWPMASGGDDAEAIARSIKHATNVAGMDHVALGSDFDGGVQTPFDATGLVQVTDALILAGFKDDEIGKVMGGNALRVLADALPAA